MGRGCGRRKRDDFQWLGSLAYVPPYSILFSGFDKDRESTSNNLADDTNRRNAEGRKTQNKNMYQ